MDPLDDLIGDEDSSDAPAETNDLKQLRAAYKRLEKQVKTQAPELEDLRTFKAEREKVDRANTASSVFQALGLNPKHAKFLPSDVELEEAAVRQWAVSEELLAAAEGEPAAPVVSSTGFAPTVIPESQAPGSKVHTQEEFEALLKTDPARAYKLYQSGRVQLNKLADIGGEFVNRV